MDLEKKEIKETGRQEEMPAQAPPDAKMPDLTKEIEAPEQPPYDFHNYFAEDEEPNSFKKSWRNIWQVILGAYGAFLPLFLTLFVALFLAFLLLRLFLM